MENLDKLSQFENAKKHEYETFENNPATIWTKNLITHDPDFCVGS